MALAALILFSNCADRAARQTDTGHEAFGERAAGRTHSNCRGHAGKCAHPAGDQHANSHTRSDGATRLDQRAAAVGNPLLCRGLWKGREQG